MKFPSQSPQTSSDYNSTVEPLRIDSSQAMATRSAWRALIGGHGFVVFPLTNLIKACVSSAKALRKRSIKPVYLISLNPISPSMSWMGVLRLSPTDIESLEPNTSKRTSWPTGLWRVPVIAT